MFKDKSLIPVEAIRLAALGMLSQSPRSYAQLARDIRHFVSHMTGPSLDLTAPPLTLLRYEGLIQAESVSELEAGDTISQDDVLRLSADGEHELKRLLRAPVRAPLNDVSRLIVALKIRFLDFLSADDRLEQIEMLIEIAEQELARIDNLYREHATEPGLLANWLSHDRSQAQARLDWFLGLRAQMRGRTVAE